MKATALAYSNIAFIKYWGKSDLQLRLPLNSSISMNLSNLQTTTTVEFSLELKNDDIAIDGKKNAKAQQRIIAHLDRFRKLANTNEFSKVVSVNNFPSSTGLSSSASGFAALTLAAANALSLNLPEKELSVLARLGSGSASRSIPRGFVEWIKGENQDSSYAYSLFPENHWNIVDIVVIVSNDKKQTPTSAAQNFVFTSPFINARLDRIDKKIKELKNIISEKNFENFGELIESESLEFHAIIMTQNPSFIYLYPETLNLMHAVRKWRQDGLPVYFTINTGHNIHLICEQKNKDNVLRKLKQLKFINKTIINYPAGPAKLINKHLF